MKGIVVSIVVGRASRGVVFSGVNRKAVLEAALALAPFRDAAELRLKLGRVIEGRVDKGRADVEDVSIFYDPCEVVG